MVQRKVSHFLLVGVLLSQDTVNRVLKKHHSEITDGQELARPALKKGDRMASRGIFHSRLFCASLKWCSGQHSLCLVLALGTKGRQQDTQRLMASNCCYCSSKDSSGHYSVSF